MPLVLYNSTSRAIHGRKWQNLSTPGRLAVQELQSHPYVRLCMTDKEMGHRITGISDSIEEKMYLTFHDSVGTYHGYQSLSESLWTL